MCREYYPLTDWYFSFNEDFADQNLITIPHDWSIDAPFDYIMKNGESQGFRRRSQIGWYKTEIDFNVTSGKYEIHFGAVYENATVWVNHEKVVINRYGYSPFKADITHTLRKGKNEILVKVDNSSEIADRWYSGSGIYRKVEIVKLPEQHLNMEDIQINTVFSKDLKSATVVVQNEANINFELIGILDGNNEILQAKSSGNKLKFQVNNVRHWCASDPFLYKLVLSLKKKSSIVDYIQISIGLRHFEFSPTEGFLVNGHKELIKGVCLHQDVGYAGIAAKKEIMEDRLIELKKMGCNAIRFAHHMPSVDFLDLCDEMGFYVYEEAFDKWTAGSYGRFFEENWEKDLQTMIRRDRNRACVFIWGVGNEVENQGQESMVSILKQMRRVVLENDNTRPITCAMNPHFWRERSIDASQIEDIQEFVDVSDDEEIADNTERVIFMKNIIEQCDIISCNYQEQWYPEIHKKYPDKPILGTEVYQFFEGDGSLMQAFKENNPAITAQNLDFVVGSFVWSGYDYLGESMGYPSKGWTGSLIRTNGSKRFGYYLMASYWSDAPFVKFFVMDTTDFGEETKPHWDTPRYQNHWNIKFHGKSIIPYCVTSNCEIIEVYLNQRLFLVESPQNYPNKLVKSYLPRDSGEILIIGKNNGIEVSREKLITNQDAQHLRFIGQTGAYPVEVSPKDFRLDVGIYDGNNMLCRDFAGEVEFEVKGKAMITATDNGDLSDDRSYRNKKCPLFYGQCSVYITVMTPGTVEVSAKVLRKDNKLQNNQDLLTNKKIIFFKI